MTLVNMAKFKCLPVLGYEGYVPLKARNAIDNEGSKYGGISD